MQNLEHNSALATKSSEISNMRYKQQSTKSYSFADKLQVRLTGYSFAAIIKNAKPKNYTGSTAYSWLVNNRKNKTNL